MPFDQAISKGTDALKQEGYGMLTDIDVKATLKGKLNVDRAETARGERQRRLRDRSESGRARSGFHL